MSVLRFLELTTGIGPERKGERNRRGEAPGTPEDPVFCIRFDLPPQRDFGSLVRALDKPYRDSPPCLSWGRAAPVTV